MKAALTIAAEAFAFALYTAWINGVFSRCPYCGKRGSWRYDNQGNALREKDEEGVVRRRRPHLRKDGRKMKATNKRRADRMSMIYWLFN